MADEDLLRTLHHRQLFVQIFVLAVLVSLAANAATNLVDRLGFWANICAIILPLVGAILVFFRYSRNVWPATTHAGVSITYNAATQEIVRPDGSEIAPWLPGSHLERELHTAWMVWKGHPANPQLPDATNPLASDVVPNGVIDCLEYLVLQRWAMDYHSGWSYGLEFEAAGRRRSSVSRPGKEITGPDVQRIFASNPVLQRLGIQIPDRANIHFMAPAFRVPEGTTFTRMRNTNSSGLVLETPFQKVVVEIAYAGGGAPRPDRMTLHFDVIAYVLQRPIKALLWPDADDHIRWSARLARRTRDAFTSPVEPAMLGIPPALVEQLQVLAAQRTATNQPPVGRT